MRLLPFFSFCAACILSNFAKAETLTVAVASNFAKPIKEIVTLYEKQTQNKVRLSFGSSGKIYAQIKNGAPFDIFLSADQSKPAALEKEGDIVEGTRFTYATGRLALWSAASHLIDDKGLVLTQNKYEKLAIANPKLAPYGRAASEVLSSLKLLDVVKSKLIFGENIAQTYQFVSTGNADVGFVAYSQILHKGNIKNGSVWIVPEKLHSPILQDAVILKRAIKSKAAFGFIRFLRNNEVRTIIASYGYKTE